MFTVGVVLAAGGSTRLGRPKQLLEFRGRPLLDSTLDVARACGFDQVVVVLGGAGAEVRASVDLTGCIVVDNAHHTTGCSSSIVAALDHVPVHADGLVLLLGDQPSIDPRTVTTLLASVADEPGSAAVAVCRYADGRGHPFWFAQPTFADLRELHGDKAVWKLLESGRWPVREVAIDAPVPLDVDTWDDYLRLLETTT